MIHSTKKQIQQALRQTGLYDLSSKSLVSKELEAYNEGFKIIEEKLEELLTAAFVQTATGEGLANHEKLVGLYPRPSSHPNARRELVVHRRSISPNDFSVSKIYRSVAAAGIRGNIMEYFFRDAIMLTVREIIDDSLSMEQIQQSLESLMPAHLEWSFDYGMLTFDMLDIKDITWNRWDNEDFTWNEFDQNGENLFQ